MTKTVVEILKEARELISVPERWCRLAYALTAVGGRVRSRHFLAAKWCGRGAVYRQLPPQSRLAGVIGRALFLLDCAAVALGFKDMPDLNDTSDHPTVLKAFDLAISKAEAGQ